MKGEKRIKMQPFVNITAYTSVSDPRPPPLRRVYTPPSDKMHSSRRPCMLAPSRSNRPFRASSRLYSHGEWPSSRPCPPHSDREQWSKHPSLPWPSLRETPPTTTRRASTATRTQHTMDVPGAKRDCKHTPAIFSWEDWEGHQNTFSFSGFGPPSLPTNLALGGPAFSKNWPHSAKFPFVSQH